MRAFALLALLTLTACGVLESRVVGEYSDAGEVLHGDILFDPLSGDGVLALEGERTGLRCEGDIWATDLGSDPLTCSGLEGKYELFCDDARHMAGDWRGRDCSAGVARGKDSRGEAFAFFFGLSEGDAQAFLAAARARADRRPPLETLRAEDVRPMTATFITTDGAFILPARGLRKDDQVTLRAAVGRAERGVILIVDSANGLALGTTRRPSAGLPLAADAPPLGAPVAALTPNGPVLAAVTGGGGDPRLLPVNRSFGADALGAPIIDAEGRLVGLVVALEGGAHALRAVYIGPLADAAGLALSRRAGGGPRFDFNRIAESYAPALARVEPLGR